ncbi:MAG: SGNH/GDSL hydrolase family protein [Clostridia bacterium]|nr:SGNH/GDSL hydrolase family protein [Clostridia bacterium]
MENVNHWKGRLWYAYGTSMTSTEYGKYVPVVEKLSGLRVVNKGIPASCLTPDGFDGRGGMKIAVTDPDDGKKEADLITVEVLPNEGPNVGGIYDTDGNSFCGCLNQCLRFLQENTAAQIVVIIMIGSNTYKPEDPHELRKIPNYEFAKIIEEVAHLNGVPVINAFCEAGFGYARVKNHDYQPDNIHLNDIGGLNMGNFIWSKLKDIPLWIGPGKAEDN